MPDLAPRGRRQIDIIPPFDYNEIRRTSRWTRNRGVPDRPPARARIETSEIRRMTETFRSTDDILRFAIEREDEAARGYVDLAAQAPIRSRAPRPSCSSSSPRRRATSGLLENIVDGTALAFDGRRRPGSQDQRLPRRGAARRDERRSRICSSSRPRRKSKAAALYGRLRDAASDPELRRLLAFLIQQEKAHKLRLEQEYEKQSSVDRRLKDQIRKETDHGKIGMHGLRLRL